MTATGLAKMMQDNLIDIEAEVQKYVPYYPLKDYPITLKQLAGNISGMPHYLISDKIENRFYPSIKDALTVFSHHKLLFKPQEKYSYSSAGFVLLSAAMEGASGVNFLSYLQDKVFNPLEMKSTEPDMGKKGFFIKIGIKRPLCFFSDQRDSPLMIAQSQKTKLAVIASLCKNTCPINETTGASAMIWPSY